MCITNSLPTVLKGTSLLLKNWFSYYRSSILGKSWKPNYMQGLNQSWMSSLPANPKPWVSWHPIWLVALFKQE